MPALAGLVDFSMILVGCHVHRPGLPLRGELERQMRMANGQHAVNQKTRSGRIWESNHHSVSDTDSRLFSPMSVCACGGFLELKNGVMNGKQDTI